jgi:hypothetical protein
MRKSRCNDSQRQAIMDSHLKGNKAVEAICGAWYKIDNFGRPHSSLKYKTPVSFESLNQHLCFGVVPANGG